MTLETFGLAALVVLGLDLWAISGVINAHRTHKVKLAWIMAIVILPVAGFLAWLLLGPKPARHDH